MKLKVYQINIDRDKNRVKFEGLEQTEQYQGKAQLDPTIYDEVFSGEVDCGNLEEVYALFNSNSPYTHRGHSMSVSDVVSVSDATELVGKIRFYNSSTAFEEVQYTDYDKYKQDIADARDVGRTIEIEDLLDQQIPSVQDGTYFCDSVGFAPVEFDESETQKPDNLLRVVMIEPCKAPYESEITNSLEGLQHAIGGMIEFTYPFYDEDGTIIMSNEESKLNGMEGNRKIFGELYAGPMIVMGDDGEGGTKSLSDEQVEKYLDRFKEIEHYTPEDVEGSLYFNISPM